MIDDYEMELIYDSFINGQFSQFIRHVRDYGQAEFIAEFIEWLQNFGYNDSMILETTLRVAKILS